MNQIKNILLIGAIVAGIAVGFHTGKSQQYERDARKIHILSKQVERFQNPIVFHNAVRAARITHTPLYQVLTGKLDQSIAEAY